MADIFGGIRPVESPFANLGDQLIQAAQAREQRKQQAAQTLLAQQQMAMHQQELGMKQAQFAHEQRRQQAQDFQSVMPFLDPNSPQFDPEMAQRQGSLFGMNIQALPGGPAPVAPQAPQYQPVEQPQAPPDMGIALSRMVPGPLGAAASMAVPTPQQASTDAREDLLVNSQQEPSQGAIQTVGDTAAAEAQAAEQKRTKYAHDLADFPRRIQEQANAMESYTQQREAYGQQQKEYQQHQQFPKFQVSTPGQQPFQVDTFAKMQQAAGLRSRRAEMAAAAYKEDPEMAKVAGQLATLGKSDQEIAETVAKLQQTRLSPGIRATVEGQKLDEKKREFDYSALSAEEKMRLEQAKIDARKKGGGSGVGKATLHEFKEQSKQFRNVVGTARSPGALDMTRRIEGVYGSLDDAIKSGNQEQISSATTAALEEAGSLLRGGVTTGISVKLLEELQSTKDQFGAQFGKWTGDPGYRVEFAKRIRTLMTQVHKEQIHRLDAAKQSYQNMTLSPGVGSAISPELKRLAMSNLQELSSVPMELGSNERRYSERGTPRAAPAPAASALPAGLPPGSVATGNKSGGKPVYKLPDGRLVVPD